MMVSRKTGTDVVDVTAALHRPTIGHDLLAGIFDDAAEEAIP